jgi:hypothetical protein
LRVFEASVRCDRAFERLDIHPTAQTTASLGGSGAQLPTVVI